MIGLTEARTEASARMEQLRTELHATARVFDPHAADGGRHGVILVMTALQRFVSVILNDDPLTLIVMRHLIYSLVDLEGGKLAPLFTPKAVKNRPRDSTEKVAFRASCAVAMDLLMESGISRKQAARDVAVALSAMGYDDGPGKPIKAHMVEDWRDRMSTERPVENPAAARFHRMKMGLNAKFPSAPSDAAKYLLSRLPLVVRPRNPKKPPA